MADDPNTKPAAPVTQPAPVAPVVKADPEPAKTPETAKPVEAKANGAAGEPNPYFPNYPKRKWHAHRGAVSVDNPNEEFETFKPAHEWHDSPELADMHRDHNDATIAVGHNDRLKRLAVSDRANGKDPAPATGPDAIKGPVRNSVAAQESIDAGNPEPM